MNHHTLSLESLFETCNSDKGTVSKATALKVHRAAEVLSRPMDMQRVSNLGVEVAVRQRERVVLGGELLHAGRRLGRQSSHARAQKLRHARHHL